MKLVITHGVSNAGWGEIHVSERVRALREFGNEKVAIESRNEAIQSSTRLLTFIGGEPARPIAGARVAVTTSNACLPMEEILRTAAPAHAALVRAYASRAVCAELHALWTLKEFRRLGLAAIATHFGIEAGLRAGAEHVFAFASPAMVPVAFATGMEICDPHEDGGYVAYPDARYRSGVMRFVGRDHIATEEDRASVREVKAAFDAHGNNPASAWPLSTEILAAQASLLERRRQPYQ